MFDLVFDAAEATVESGTEAAAEGAAEESVTESTTEPVEPSNTESYAHPIYDSEDTLVDDLAGFIVAEALYRGLTQGNEENELADDEYSMDNLLTPKGQEVAEEYGMEPENDKQYIGPAS